MTELVNHTGRELELMLAGLKPMAMFYAQTDELPNEEFVPDVAFRPHVKAGTLARAEIELGTTTPAGTPTVVRYVFFALRSEEWRMQVMAILVRNLYAGGGWNETCERVQGTLLGYSDAENDAHWARLRAFHAGAP